VLDGVDTEGEHKGHLEYLHFPGTDENNLLRWWSVNTDTLPDDFRAIFGEWRAGILSRLRSGETVKLPRNVELDEIRGKIGGAGNE
jgi:hypothetical protein